MTKKKQIRNIIVNIKMPKNFRRNGYAPQIAGILFANPVAGLFIIGIGLLATYLIGALSLPILIGMFFNPWMWVFALGITLAFSPKSRTVTILAVMMAMIFWGFGLYQDYMTNKQICGIPILGIIACGFWDVFTFVPKLFSLIIHIVVSFAMIWSLSFIRYELEKK